MSSKSETKLKLKTYFILPDSSTPHVCLPLPPNSKAKTTYFTGTKLAAKYASYIYKKRRRWPRMVQIYRRGFVTCYNIVRDSASTGHRNSCTANPVRKTYVRKGRTIRKHLNEKDTRILQEALLSIGKGRRGYRHLDRGGKKSRETRKAQEAIKKTSEKKRNNKHRRDEKKSREARLALKAMKALKLGIPSS